MPQRGFRAYRRMPRAARKRARPNQLRWRGRLCTDPDEACWRRRLYRAGSAALQVRDHLEVVTGDLADVDLVHMHQAQQFFDRLGHRAAALVAGTAALGHADAAPELLLVQAESVPDLARVEASFSQFHVRVMSERFEGNGTRANPGLIPLSCKDAGSSCGFALHRRFLQEQCRHASAAADGQALEQPTAGLRLSKEPCDATDREPRRDCRVRRFLNARDAVWITAG